MALFLHLFDPLSEFQSFTMSTCSFGRILFNQDLIAAFHKLSHVFQREESFDHKLLSIVNSRGWVKEIQIMLLKIQKRTFAGCDYSCKVFRLHLSPSGVGTSSYEKLNLRASGTFRFRQKL